MFNDDVVMGVHSSLDVTDLVLVLRLFHSFKLTGTRPISSGALNGLKYPLNKTLCLVVFKKRVQRTKTYP